MVETTLNTNMINNELKTVFYGSAVTIPYAANITPVLTQGNVFKVTQTGNMVIDNPTIVNNGFYYLYVTLDGTGGYTLGFGDQWNLLGSGVYDNTANKVNIFSFMTFSGQAAIQYYINQRP